MLAALFSSSRGIVFSSMISNTDDHLRNHGFLCRSRLVAAVPGLRPQSGAHRYQTGHSDQDEARKIAAEVGHALPPGGGKRRGSALRVRREIAWRRASSTRI